MNKLKALRILNKLEKLYPDAKISLEYSNDFEFLVAVILSAQTTDSQVNKVTKNLFPKYRGKNERQEIENFANADFKKLEEDVKSIGLFRTKAKNIKRTADIILKNHDGKVPETMSGLLALPGVGRKTANVVLKNSFGIAVDTHVRRLAKEFGLTKSTNPAIIERDLMRVFDKKDWPRVTALLIAHGRKKLPLNLNLGKIN